MFRITAVVFLAPNLFAMFGYFVVDIRLFVVLTSIYYMGLYAMAISIYQSTALQFGWELFKYHRLAYSTHIRSFVGLFITTEATLIGLFLGQAIGLASYFCEVTEEQLDSMFSGICDGRNDDDDWSEHALRVAMLAGNFLFMLPMLTFFWLNEPHDCYVCLGKDPERLYSRFQLTLEDRAKRRLRAKLNPEQ